MVFVGQAPQTWGQAERPPAGYAFPGKPPATAYGMRLATAGAVGRSRHVRRAMPASTPRRDGDGHKRKGPPRFFLGGPVNPAATYSPGPVGQVPSAIGGLTSVFGMGTGMTLPR